MNNSDPVDDSDKGEHSEATNVGESSTDENATRIDPGTFAEPFPATMSASASVPKESYAASTTYRRLKLLGEGGLGRVWLAHDLRVDRQVAIKELHPKQQGNAEIRTRFLREARIGAHLQHPNIAPFYHIGVDDADKPFIVMQRIGGETLEDRMRTLKSPKLDWIKLHSELHQLITLVVQVCEGVAYAHSRGVIHRDLKPSNIMTGKFGEVFVLDWGLGKELDASDSPDATTSERRIELETGKQISLEDSGLTIPGSLMGTLAYMAPEQTVGCDIGPHSDVFGLGGILYFILTGRPPHDVVGESIRSVARRIQTTTPRPVLGLNSTAPRRLCAIVAKATALRPADRYSSAEDLAADLRRWLARDPVLAYREPLIQRWARWTLQHRQTVSVIALAAFSVVLALVISNLHQWASIEGMVSEELMEMRDRVEDVAHGIEREVQLTASLMNFVSRLPALRDCLEERKDADKSAASLARATRTLTAFVDQQPHVLEAMLVDETGAAVIDDAIMKPLADNRRFRETVRKGLQSVLSVPPGEILIAWSTPDEVNAGQLKAFLPVIVGAPVRSEDKSRTLGAIFMETQIGFHGFQSHDTPDVAFAGRFADCFYADHTGRIHFCSIGSGLVNDQHEGMPWLQRIFPEVTPLIEATALPATIEMRLTKNRHTIYAHRLILKNTHPVASPIIAVARPIEILRSYSSVRNGYLISAAMLTIALSALLALMMAWLLVRVVRST